MLGLFKLRDGAVRSYRESLRAPAVQWVRVDSLTNVPLAEESGARLVTEAGGSLVTESETAADARIMPIRMT